MPSRRLSFHFLSRAAGIMQLKETISSKLGCLPLSVTVDNRELSDDVNDRVLKDVGVQQSCMFIVLYHDASGGS